MDPASLSLALSGAKNLFDIIDKVHCWAKGSGSDQAPDELKNELSGSDSIAREQSAQILQMVNAKTFPFLLRVGKSFQLPSDLRKMEQAVKDYNLWDWTYCFDTKNISSQTQRHIRHLFVDSNDPSLFKPDISTTTLALSEKPMDPELGDTLYIAGIALGNSEYDHIYSLAKGSLLPVVVVKSVNDETLGFDNPISMNFYLTKALDFLFAHAPDFYRYGEIVVDHCPPDRKLPNNLIHVMQA